MGKTNTHSQFLEYKVAKIIRLIKKIKQKLQEEGLDLRQLPRLINHSLKLNDLSNDHSCASSAFEQFTIQSLSKNSNKFTASTLLALSQVYQNLLSSLDDQSNYIEIKKISSTKQPKQTLVKQEQIFPSIEVKKQRSIGVKLEEGVDVGKDNNLEQQQKLIRKIKKELSKKKMEMKMLKTQIKQGGRQIQPENRDSRKKEKKSHHP